MFSFLTYVLVQIVVVVVVVLFVNGEGDVKEIISSKREVEIEPNGKIIPKQKLSSSLSSSSSEEEEEGEENNIINNNNNNNNDILLLEPRIQLLEKEIEILENIFKEQEQLIKNINDSFLQYTYLGEQYGIMYQSSDEHTLGLLSSYYNHTNPFIMIRTSVVKLPSRDSFSMNAEHNKYRINRSKYIHIIITLTQDGTLQLWDEYQSLLFTLTADKHDWSDSSSSGSSTSQFICTNIISDIYHDTSKGGTWLVLACRDTSFIKYYEITAWRIEKRRNSGIHVLEHGLSAIITYSRTISIPTICITPSASSSSSRDATSGQPKITECDDNAQKDIQHVTSVQIHNIFRQRYVFAGTNKGYIYGYRLVGDSGASRSPHNSLEAYINPNNGSAAILYMLPGFHKEDIVYITAFGWQLIQIPRFEDNSAFCGFENDRALRLSSVAVDKTSRSNILYLGTTSGELLVYDMNAKINRGQRCRPIDRFFVGSEASPLTIQVISGYVLVGTNTELYVYNQSQTKAYHPLVLNSIRRYENDFRLQAEVVKSTKIKYNDEIFMSAYEDPSSLRTVIAYGGGGIIIQNDNNNINNNNENRKGWMTILESSPPGIIHQDRFFQSIEGFSFQKISKLPLILGAGLLFFIIFKRRSGGSGGSSPFSKLFGLGPKPERKPRRPGMATSRPNFGMQVRDRWEMTARPSGAIPRANAGSGPNPTELAATARNELSSDSD